MFYVDLKIRHTEQLRIYSLSQDIKLSPLSVADKQTCPQILKCKGIDDELNNTIGSNHFVPGCSLYIYQFNGYITLIHLLAYEHEYECAMYVRAMLITNYCRLL